MSRMGMAKDSVPESSILEDSLDRARSQATYDALRPLSVGLAILWTLFIPFNIVDLPDSARDAVVAHDVVMVLTALGLYFLLQKDRVPVRWANALAALLACGIASNILLAYWLTGRDFLSFYISIVLIAAGNLILSTRWLVAVGVSILSAWTLLTLPQVSSNELANLVFLQVAATLVAVTIHLTRIRFTGRIFELRQRDREREVALKKALSETEFARRELDQRVADRTRELQSAHDDLTAQFEEGIRLEAERRALEAELQHAQRLESVGQLAGGIAHDFNNLLTVIGGNMDMVLDTAGSVDEVQRTRLKDARDAADRATELTTELLAYSRKQPVVLEAIDPRKTIRGMRSMIERATGENIELQTELNPIEGSVLAGRGQIEQVVMNLVLNACDAMAAGGRLRIELDQVEKVRDPLASVESNGPFIRLQVIDTGCGMDDSIRQKVFEPYFTTKETGKGTGLGLSVVHGIVKQHRGHLTVESAPLRGSTFVVYLPCVQSPESVEVSAVSRVSEDSAATETILLAEDEAAVRRLSKTLLEKMGYQVLAAEDAQEALDIAQGYEGEIHLLLTDVVMPGMQGPELAEQLKRTRPGIRVLFVSGYTDPSIFAGLDLSEGRSFLQKPFTLKVLESKVRQLLLS